MSIAACGVDEDSAGRDVPGGDVHGKIRGGLDEIWHLLLLPCMEFRLKRSVLLPNYGVLCEFCQ